jgi:hypothetical protein
MIKLDGLLRSMNLLIALSRTTAGVALVSRPRHGLVSGASLLLQLQAAPGGAGQAHSEVEIGDCVFFADRWWCP